jgi:hypothetical protein
LHPPQFDGSLLVLAQPEAHCMLPALHGYEQLMPLHDGLVFGGALAPQLVQLGPHAFVSLATQLPLQLWRTPGHLHALL